MKAAIVRFPGSNCDEDAFHAVSGVLGHDAVYCWHKDHDLQDADIVVLPGGFSYGDYLRPGAIARFSPIMREVVDFAKAGGPVLAICNGFQIACEAGLLPGALLRNESLRFISAPVHLRVESVATQFTSGYHVDQVIRMPIAHGDGRYTADADTVERLEGEGHVLFRYVTPDGERTSGANPNGSVRNIAGIVNSGGNVLGMMPHPERAMEPLMGSVDGVPLFTSVFESLLAGTRA
ncbi:MAG TPA: phosphoribosylformylglycinamidine synthase subunit PurQ [Gemmatimonas sp.]|nr:phosphoribosylformylglycinamidine synthase subunit PurQ [Gemmatimonas sp.]